MDENLGVMSVGFLLPSPDDAVIWRGPKKHSKIMRVFCDIVTSLTFPAFNCRLCDNWAVHLGLGLDCLGKLSIL